MKTKPIQLMFLLCISAQTMAFANTGPASVSEKLLKAFNETYPQAQTVDWR